MSGFNLRILTPQRVVINRDVEKIVVRTIEGDVGILKNHINYVSAIKAGLITIFFLDGCKEQATLKDGLIAVIDGKVDIIVFDYVEKK